MELGEQTIIFLAVNKNGDEVILITFLHGKEKYGRTRGQRTTRNISLLRIIIQRSYFQKVLFIN